MGGPSPADEIHQAEIVDGNVLLRGHFVPESRLPVFALLFEPKPDLAAIIRPRHVEFERLEQVVQLFGGIAAIVVQVGKHAAGGDMILEVLDASLKKRFVNGQRFVPAPVVKQLVGQVKLGSACRPVLVDVLLKNGEVAGAVSFFQLRLVGDLDGGEEELAADDEDFVDRIDPARPDRTLDESIVAGDVVRVAGCVAREHVAHDHRIEPRIERVLELAEPLPVPFQQHVVRIEPHHVLFRRLVERIVAGRGEVLNPFEIEDAVRVTGYDFLGPVGRTRVDDVDLVNQAPDGVQATPDRLFLVLDNHA